VGNRVRPLAYQFVTPRVYYPLKVTNLYGGGYGTVELFFVLSSDVQWDRPLNLRPMSDRATAKPGWLWSTQAYLKPKEAAGLHPEMPEMLAGGQGRLHAVRYQGPLYFEDDIACPVNLTGTYADGLCHRILKEYGRGAQGRMEWMLSVPFSFDRKRVIEDKTALVEHVRQLLRETCDPGSRVLSEGNWTGQISSEFEREFLEKYKRRYYGRPQRTTLVFENGRALTFLIVNTRDEGRKIIGLSAGAP
jgi:hypothetical protein